MNLRLLTIALLVPAVASFAQTGDLDRKIEAAGNLYRQGKAELALKQFQTLLTSNPQNPDILGWIGFLHLRANRPKDAVGFLEQAYTFRPKDVEIAINLGNAYKSLNQYDKALAKYQTVERLLPRMFEPHYNSGTIWLAKSNWPQAIDEFNQAVALKPDDPFVLNNLGFAYEANKNREQAVRYYKQASDLRKTNKVLARNAGINLVRLRRFTEAIEYLERAGRDEVAVEMALGDAYTKVGRLKDALSLYETIKDPNARTLTFWFNVGVLRSELKDDSGAEQAYRKALELSPNDLDSLNNLGLLLFRIGSAQEALTILEKYAGLNSRSVTAKVNWGAAAAKAGDTRRAIVAWKYALKEDPGRVPLRLDLANLLWQVGEYAQAQAHYEQVIASEPQNSEALNGMGICHLRQGKLAAAEAAFRSCIAFSPKFMPGYNNLAIVLERGHQTAEAINVLTAALKIEPGNAEIQRNLNRLRSDG